MNKKETLAINNVYMKTYERIKYFNSDLAKDEMRGVKSILEALNYSTEDMWQIENEVDKKHMKFMERSAWEVIETIFDKYKIKIKYDLEILDNLKYNCTADDIIYIDRNIVKIEELNAA